MHSLDQFNKAIKFLELGSSVLEQIGHPNLIVEKNFSVRMDDGNMRNFKGFRVHHSRVLGPAKGGLRFHPDVTRDEVIDLASWMTWKTALLGLPLGGGKGGVACNPSELSVNELERMTREYTKEFAFMFGPNIDIPAPDVGTNEQVMAWMVDEYGIIKGERAYGVVTGKPLDLGGLDGRNTATGKGLFYVTDYILKSFGKNIEDATVSVQGFGNVGSHIALFLHEAGANVIGISDSRGAIFNKDGIDVPALIEYKKKTGGPIAFSRLGDEIDTNSILMLSCDILIPSAVESVITARNVHDINAQFIVEGANGPITLEAEEALLQKGIKIIPDILANSGGVVVSYFEWKQNQDKNIEKWTLDSVNQNLKERIEKAANNVLEVAQGHQTDMRTAAYIIAISRVADGLTKFKI